MKPLSEQDHYEVLEISRHARSEQIAQAHKLALTTYSDESLAGYSIFGEGDAAALRERVEIAYRVLSDSEGRRAYDASLASALGSRHRSSFIVGLAYPLGDVISGELEPLPTQNPSIR